MIKASLVAFLVSYLSVFHLPRIDLFWGLFIPLIIVFIIFNNHNLRYLFVAIFFYLWTQVAIQLHLDSRYDLQQKATVTMVLEVNNLPKIKEKSIAFNASPVRIIKSNVNFDFKSLKNIKLNWYYPKQQLTAGQQWQMTLRLQPPHGYQNKGGFDYERWMFYQGISATGYVLTNEKIVLVKQTPALSHLTLRAWLSEKIEKFSSQYKFSALFQTLSIGDSKDLDPHLKQLFIQTGTAHLLVISGLHIGLLSMLFYFLGLRLWHFLNNRFKTRIIQRDFGVILAWVSAAIYSALAGFSIPTVRALIMLSLVFLLLLRRQKNEFLNIFCSAVVLILVLQPLALLSYSFWLSFLAILLIVLSQYVLSWQSNLKAGISLQLLFSILFIPLNAAFFNQFLPVSFFANLVLIPIMSFIVIPLNLLATFLTVFDWSALSYLYALLDFIIGFLVDYLNLLTEFFGKGTPLKDHQSFLMLVSAVGAILLLFLPKHGIKIPALLIMIMPWFYFDKGLKKDEINLVFFDIGMGTSVLIQTQSHVLLYDFGPGNKDSYQPAKWVILPYLQSVGISQIDAAVISHSDQDHYGGIWSFWDEKALKQTQLMSGTPEKLKKLLNYNKTIKPCHEMNSWRWDGVEFKFLEIHDQTILSENNLSCVLKVSSQYGSVLLTGDIESERENDLIKNQIDWLKSDVLLVPHHGSLTSSTLTFLKEVNPSHAVVTTGYLNRWGFPKKQIVKRLEALNINWLNTAIEGEINLKITEEGNIVRSFRKEAQELWY